MQTNYPSTKRIMEYLRIDKATAEKVRGVMSRQIRVTDNADFPKTNSWINQCHNMPSGHELRMAAIDELIGGFGVEVIGDVKNYPPRIDCEYVNMGDTYTGTVLYARGRYMLGTFGDYVERNNL